MSKIKLWMQKKKPLLFAAAAIAVLTAGMSLAFFTDAETAANTMKTGSVQIETEETIDGLKKTDISVTGTGKSPCYVRMRVDVPVLKYQEEGKTETYGFEKEEKTETYGFENRAEKDAFEKPNENENVNVNENGNENEKPKTITASTVVAGYHRLCPSFPAVKVISDKRKKAIHARLNSGYTLTDFEQAFTKAERSRFLRGGNKNNWQADFDWLMKDGNLPKVLEGKYDDDSGTDYGRGEEGRYDGTVL